MGSESAPGKKVLDGVEEEHGIEYLVVCEYAYAVGDWLMQWFSCVGAFELNPEIGILRSEKEHLIVPLPCVCFGLWRAWLKKILARSSIGVKILVQDLGSIPMNRERKNPKGMTLRP